MTAQQLKSIVDLLTAKPPPVDPPVSYQRARMAKLIRHVHDGAGIRPVPVDAGGVPAAWVGVPEDAAQRTILYLHGGGYCIGSIETHKGLSHTLGEDAAARTLLLDYRLAPEHPFPAALDDAVAGYRWLIDQGHVPGRIALAGDSAGGGLTVAALLALRDAGVPLPACGVCISPWTDLSLSSDSIEALAPVDPMVGPAQLAEMAAWYVGDTDVRTPLVSPIYAALDGLPPLLVQVGEREALLDDAVILAERVNAVGGAATLRRWPEMIHVWHLFAQILSEGQEAIAEAGAFIRAHAA